MVSVFPEIHSDLETSAIVAPGVSGAEKATLLTVGSVGVLTSTNAR
jgi:hypothetical protein